MTNKNNTVLYVGVTNNLSRRVVEHREGRGSEFTKKYQLTKLIYFELFTDPENAIKREKQIKAGSRAKKIALIEKNNSNWEDILNEL